MVKPKAARQRTRARRATRAEVTELIDSGAQPRVMVSPSILFDYVLQPTTESSVIFRWLATYPGVVSKLAFYVEVVKAPEGVAADKRKTQFIVAISHPDGKVQSQNVEVGIGYIEIEGLGAVAPGSRVIVSAFAPDEVACIWTSLCFYLGAK